jgi:hypothetical protein
MNQRQDEMGKDEAGKGAADGCHVMAGVLLV